MRFFFFSLAAALFGGNGQDLIRFFSFLGVIQRSALSGSERAIIGRLDFFFDRGQLIFGLIKDMLDSILGIRGLWERWKHAWAWQGGAPIERYWHGGGGSCLPALFAKEGSCIDPFSLPEKIPIAYKGGERRMGYDKIPVVAVQSSKRRSSPPSRDEWDLLLLLYATG